ncbi:glycoside hydrolase family 31 protein [Paenibacillus sp. GYB004]|uniref:TIM-barrel domain-containing protein n=1 Tax=Paenibacillus sp. GYB004 TaxID=2994393 RepID=UPI002F96E3A7
MNEHAGVQMTLGTGGSMRIDTIAPDTFRVRFDLDGTFAEPDLVRYDIIRCPQQGSVPAAASRRVVVTSDSAELHIDGEDGQFRLVAANGRELLRTQQQPLDSNTQRFDLIFALVEGESCYGLGNIDSGTIDRRGWKGDIWADDHLVSSAPIPFLMSTRGWALLMNTTRRHSFDIGCTDEDRFRISGEGTGLDLFLFAGSCLAELLHRYTGVAGKPLLLPMWAYGLNYSGRKLSNAQEVVNEAMKFRQLNIPCDLIGLSEDSVESKGNHILHKRWHAERFPMSSHDLVRGVTFLGVLRRKGFKFSLFLRCTYDVTAEEERRTAGNAAEPAPIPAADFPVWYDHLKPFVDDGVAAFVLSVCSPAAAYPDRQWANGMNSAQLHNLYAVLAGKQMYRGFREHTGQRPMIHVERGYIGMQQYIATSSGTYYNLPHAMTDMMNYGLSGHANTTTNMRLISKEGIHSGFLLPWARIHSSQYFLHPSYLEPDLLDMLQIYARLRYRLIPYLYSAAHVANRTGMPIMRAMPLAYGEDPMCRNLRQQYMLGEYLLVVAFGNRVYLPDDEWIDYWTGKRYSGPQWLECDPPERAGGLLFVRAGAIIPMWPVLDYVGQAPVTTVALEVYPHRNSSFCMYEDDGLSFGYENGQVAVTRIECEATPERVVLQIARRDGSYDGMPADRNYELIVHLNAKPVAVTVDGNPCTEQTRRLKSNLVRGWRYDRPNGAVRLFLEEAPEEEGFARIELLLNVPNVPHHSAKRAAPAVRGSSRNGGFDSGSDDGDNQPRRQLSLSGPQAGANKERMKGISAGDAPGPDSVETALSWWRGKMSGTSSDAWRSHLSYACHQIVRRAESCGWEPSEVFGADPDDILQLQGIADPDQGERLLQRLSERYAAHASRNLPCRPTHPAVRGIIAIVEQEIDGDLGLKTLAGRVALHPFHLSRLFPKETGQTFSDYVMSRRMLHARACLEAGCKVYEVASDTGFKDPGNFSKAFSKYWGVPPIYLKNGATSG